MKHLPNCSASTLAYFTKKLKIIDLPALFFEGLICTGFRYDLCDRCRGLVVLVYCVDRPLLFFENLDP